MSCESMVQGRHLVAVDSRAKPIRAAGNVCKFFRIRLGETPVQLAPACHATPRSATLACVWRKQPTAQQELNNRSASAAVRTETTGFKAGAGAVGPPIMGCAESVLFRAPDSDCGQTDHP
jgi:hypothetical protein